MSYATPWAPDLFDFDFSAPSFEWQQALSDVSPNLPAVLAQQTATPTQDWIETLSRVASTVIMSKAQRDLLEIQMERARQGLPPLDASQYAPGVTARVGLSPELERGLLIGGAVLLGWFLLRGSRRG